MAPNDADRNESVLVAQAKEGSETAIEELVRAFWPVAYRTLARMLRCPSDAEEVTQEVMCSVVSHLSSFRGESSFRTWFHRIAINHGLMSLRRRITRERLLSSVRDMAFVSTARGPRTPEQILLEAERRRLIEDGIERLPANYSAVMALYAREGKTMNEMAAQLDLSTAAVKTRLNRGRSILRREIDRRARPVTKRTARMAAEPAVKFGQGPIEYSPAV